MGGGVALGVDLIAHRGEAERTEVAGVPYMEFLDTVRRERHAEHEVEGVARCRRLVGTYPGEGGHHFGLVRTVQPPRTLSAPGDRPERVSLRSGRQEALPEPLLPFRPAGRASMNRGANQLAHRTVTSCGNAPESIELGLGKQDLQLLRVSIPYMDTREDKEIHGHPRERAACFAW